MTTVAFPPSIQWGASAYTGSSVRNAAQPAVQKAYSGQGFLVYPTGISRTARDIDESVIRMLLAYNQWWASQHAPELDVEREIVALMPPKKRYTVKLHIKSVRRGTPLACLEDLETDY